MSQSYLDQSRSIYARDRGAVGPWAPWLPKKWEGKKERVAERELGSEREKERSSSNDLRRKAYLTNYDIEMQDNTIQHNLIESKGNKSNKREKVSETERPT